MKAILCAAMFAALTLAGCTVDEDGVGYRQENTVTISVSGDNPSGSRSRNIECDDDGHVTVSLGGRGNVDTTVRDSAGMTVFSDSSGLVNGGYSASQDLEGREGTWVLEASWIGVEGGLSIVLRC